MFVVSESPGASKGIDGKTSMTDSGPVAHTMVISDRNKIARIEYERKRFNSQIFSVR
jgi:hypothetical protein